MTQRAAPPPRQDQPLYLETAPGPAISSFVERLWISSTLAGPRQAMLEVLPDGNVDLVLCLSDHSCGAHLFGPATQRLAAAAPPGNTLLGMRFLPGLAPSLADVAQPDLLNACLSLDKVLGFPAQELGERLHAIPRPEQRLAFLGERLARMRGTAMAGTLCRKAAKLALAAGGDLRVSDLAKSLGASTRSLERSFMSELGLTPKAFLRLLRLQRAVEGLRRAEPDHAALAAQCGFTDQAHMVNEFRRLSGRTPGCLARDLQARALLSEPIPGAPLLVMS